MSQVEYLGRWVDRDHFRVFVYNETGQKLANSYDEFQALIGSGLWFTTKELISKDIKSELMAKDIIKPVDEVKVKREKSRNQFRQAVSLGK